jgi:hypothetical protein
MGQQQGLKCILQRHVAKDPLPSTRSHILSFHHLQITHQIYEPINELTHDEVRALMIH